MGESERAARLSARDQCSDRGDRRGAGGVAGAAGPAGAAGWHQRRVSEPGAAEVCAARERVDAILAQLYVSGASSRDLRRALARLLGPQALSRSAVSRVVARLQLAFRTWRTRSLAQEPIAFLYLDGQRVRVRADRGVTTAVVLMALGVRPSGEKVVLALRLVSDETTAAWRSLLEDLTSRGLARPELVISDGSQGAQAALDLTWPGLPHQRCLVHKLRNLLAATPRALHGALITDFRRFSEATNPAAVHAGVAHFRRAWMERWSGAVVCLDEAGAHLTAYTAFPAALHRVDQVWRKCATPASTAAGCAASLKRRKSVISAPCSARGVAASRLRSLCTRQR